MFWGSSGRNCDRRSDIWSRKSTTRRQSLSRCIEASGINSFPSPQPITVESIHDDLNVPQFQHRPCRSITSFAQLSTTTIHNAFATRACFEGCIFHLLPRSAINSVCCSSNPFGRICTAGSRTCHGPGCSPSEAGIRRIERSG